MKPFKDTYVMYWLLEFIDESSIICLCKTSKKLNEICKSYIEMEDDKRFEVILRKFRWTENDNSSLLEECCRHHDVIKIKKILKINLDLECLEWEWGLHGACQGGHLDIVKLMIEKGSNDWEWALLYACIGGHIDMVKLMIEKGAGNWNGGLKYACCGGHMEIVKLMIEKGATQCLSCHKSIEEHLKK